MDSMEDSPIEKLARLLITVSDDDCFIGMLEFVDTYVRVLIAEFENLPEKVVRSLSKDEDYMVRATIAKRANLPDDIIYALTVDESASVRMTVAKGE
jgi:hypothetical protein